MSKWTLNLTQEEECVSEHGEIYIMSYTFLDRPHSDTPTQIGQIGVFLMQPYCEKRQLIIQ